jgi:hypothetical protein
MIVSTKTQFLGPLLRTARRNITYTMFECNMKYEYQLNIVMIRYVTVTLVIEIRKKLFSYGEVMYSFSQSSLSTFSIT